MLASSSNGARRTGSAAPVVLARPQPFGVDVQRRNDVAIVLPHGELFLFASPDEAATALVRAR